MRINRFDDTYRMPKDVRTTADKNVIKENIISGERWLEFFEMKIVSMNKKRQRKSRKRYLNNYYKHRRIVRDMRKRLNAL